MSESVRQPLDRRRRALLLLLLAVAGGLLLAGGIVWWDTRELNQAEALLDGGEPAAALKLVDQFLREHPRDGQALMLRARVLVALGDWTGAIRLYEQVGAATTDDLHALTTALLHLEQWGAALPVLKMLSEELPDEADVLHELAACQAKLGQYEDGLKTAERFTQLPECESRGLLLLGTLHRDSGKHQSTIDVWSRLLEREPEAQNLQIPPHDFLDEFGRVLLQNGQPDRALELLSRSVELSQSASTAASSSDSLDRARAKTLTALGDACLQTGRQSEAEAHWIRATELCPDCAEPREALARTALRLGNGAAAVEWLKPLLASRVELGSVAYSASRAFAMIGDAEAAELWRTRFEKIDQAERLRSTLDQVLIDSPNSIWSAIIRAWRFADAGNWSEANRILEPIIDSRRNSTTPAPAADPQAAADAAEFIDDLHEAVKTRGTLPSLSRLPVRDF